MADQKGFTVEAPTTPRLLGNFDYLIGSRSDDMAFPANSASRR